MRPSELLAAALVQASVDLQRLPGRMPAQGLLEVRELAPALESAMVLLTPRARVVREARHEIRHWNRPTTQVDLAVFESQSSIADICVELKVWDIGHQLFDLAKITCLLAAGAGAGFLVCVAETARDFDRHPGGVLFPPNADETREFRFCDLIESHSQEWQRHVGQGGPQPTGVPTAVSTTALTPELSIVAYPGHVARAVEVRITDSKLIPLTNGWPDRRDASAPPPSDA